MTTTNQGDDIENMDIKDVRKLLRQAQTENSQLRRDVASREGQLAVHNAGLTHLSEIQRGAVVHVLGNQDPTPENLKAAATALGFATEAPKPSTPPTDTTGTPPNGDGTPPAQQDPANPPQFVDEMPGANHPDPRVQAAISGLTRTEYAEVMARRGGSGGQGGFNEAMGKASSKKEVLAAISNYGGNEGIVLDSDLA